MQYDVPVAFTTGQCSVPYLNVLYCAESRSFGLCNWRCSYLPFIFNFSKASQCLELWQLLIQ